MSLDLKIQSPTEWTEIKNQEPPFDTMLLVGGNPIDPETGNGLWDINLVVTAFLSSRSKVYIAVDSEGACLNEWFIPKQYHVVYDPEGNPVKVMSTVEGAIPPIFDD